MNNKMSGFQSNFFTAMLTSSLLVFASFASPALSRAEPARSERHGPVKPLQILTFNTGLLNGALGHWQPFDLVPCVAARLDAQLIALSRVLHPPFVVLLQEVWNQEDRDTYRRWARDKGYSVVTRDETAFEYVTISSETIRDSKFIAFKQNPTRSRFGMFTSWIEYDGALIQVVNTHTDYSPLDEVGGTHLSHLREVAALTTVFEYVQLSACDLAREPLVIAGDINVGADLAYDKKTYDPAKELWQKGWQNHFSPAWSHAKSGITWDEGRNPLVNDPPMTVSAFLDEKGHWGYKNSTLDHIFASPELEIVESHTELNQRVPLSDCEDYSKGGKGFLSDHYAVEAQVVLKRD